MEKKYTTFLNKTTSAYDLLKYLGSQSDFSLKLPIDIEGIIKYLNIKLSKNPNFKKIKLDGMITVKNQEPEIWINPMKTQFEERIRFTLAHELAHYFLAEDTLKSELHFDTLYKKVNDDSEYDVDYLASALLINKDLLESAYKITDSISVLSKVFDVSESVMTLRLITLGLI